MVCKLGLISARVFVNDKVYILIVLYKVFYYSFIDEAIFWPLNVHMYGVSRILAVSLVAVFDWVSS